MERHTVTITIDFDEILDMVYAQSAWHAAYDKTVRVLTPDNRNMLLLKLKEGYADLRQRVLGYLIFDNYNPNIQTQNLTMTRRFFFLFLLASCGLMAMAQQFSLTSKGYFRNGKII